MLSFLLYVQYLCFSKELPDADSMSPKNTTWFLELDYKNSASVKEEEFRILTAVQPFSRGCNDSR
jgi:hypothetical protein